MMQITIICITHARRAANCIQSGYGRLVLLMGSEGSHTPITIEGNEQTSSLTVVSDGVEMGVFEKR